ncbi:RICIN domain-containing protein [Atopobium sp. oral taxon 810]|uniref:RICIN domain-containing protein n=1 Tax=Atopobium sp. oral taxon 810 TaxID=712158 RepID=UPI0003965598|nr:RICIN domain-containing protein [Atopobium sp. oral taxon 810]ERI04546.1 ricin-type beta-trefoil lectin domain protein [Atopobium sp. oral taxon 810 str. F0209]
MYVNRLQMKQIPLVLVLGSALVLSVPTFAYAEVSDDNTLTPSVSEEAVSAGLNYDLDSEEDPSQSVVQLEHTTNQAKSNQLIDATKTRLETTTMSSNAIENEDPSAEVPLKDHSFVIESAVAGRGSVDVKGGSKKKGANVQLYEANGTGAQEWSFQADKDGYVIKNKQSGLVLDVTGAKAANGTNVQQYVQNGTAAQRWYVDWVNEQKGQARLRSALVGNFVLDVSGARSTNGTNLQIYKSNGTNAQIWNLVDVLAGFAGVSDPTESLHSAGNAGVQPEAGSYTFTSRSSSLAVDIAGASNKAGAKVQLYRKNNTMAQGFYLSREGKYWRIRNDKSGLSVSASAADIVAGTMLAQQMSQKNNLYQLWELVSDGAGSYYFVNAKTRHALADSGSVLQTADVAAQSSAQLWGLSKWNPSITQGFYRINSVSNSSQVLDVSGGSTKVGANVQSYSWNGGYGQRWQLKQDSVGWQLRNIGSGLYLSHDGHNVMQATADKASYWSLTFGLGDLGSCGGFRLQSALGAVLNIAGGVAKNTANIELKQQNGSDTQLWIFEGTRVFDGEGWYEIRAAGNGDLALDVSGASGNDGANVQIYKANSTAAQTWHISSLGGNWYRIVSANSNKALGVKGSVQSNRANVAQYTTNNVLGQKWQIVFGDTGFTFVNGSGKVLDIAAGQLLSGTNVQQDQNNGTVAQGWLLRKSKAKGVGAAIEQFSQYMVAMAEDDKHGYDQAYRWGERGDYDCSSLVISSLMAAGFKTGSACWTGDMRSNLKSRGWQVLYISDVRDLQAGDVLLSDLSHTAGIVSNTTEVAAHQNEWGGITGGKPGDQTGYEICTRPLAYYSSMGGWKDQWWDVVLRPTSRSMRV